MQTIQASNRLFNLERKSAVDKKGLEYKILQTITLSIKGVISVQDSKNLQKELEKYKFEEGILVLIAVDALLICSLITYTEELIERLK